MQKQAMFPVQNTIGVDSLATAGASITRIDQLRSALTDARSRGLKWRPLGAGSNILPMSHVAGFIGQIDIAGVEELTETADSVVVRVGAGENWHRWVQRALAESWYGLENLVCIPGNVGAAPIQNIGAYGVELQDVVASVHCVDEAGDDVTLSRTECEFGYRDSVFKRKGGLTVVAVSFRLSKTPRVKADYPDVQKALAARGLRDPLPQDLASIITEIRNEKLPDPDHHANVGSFFKNPLIGPVTLKRLQSTLSDISFYPTDAQNNDAQNNNEALYKISAAQLIDSLGWKHKGQYGVYCWPRQPLVLVNNDAKLGEDVLAFAELIRTDVHKHYGIQLELEPSLLT